MTHVSLSIATQRWWPRFDQLKKYRSGQRMKNLIVRLVAGLRFKRRPAIKPAYIKCSLDQLSDHELKDIGLTRDWYLNSAMQHSHHLPKHLQYDRLRRLPGE